MRKHGLTRLVVVTLALGSASIATADPPQQVRYVGVHPVAKAHGGGSCYIEGPHVHVYEAEPVQYRDHDGWSFFVGDPVAYGYDGKTWAYKGHHPVHVHDAIGDASVDVEFCYLDGPHYHAFAAPPEADFELVGGAYFYVGDPPAIYVEERPRYVAINTVYRPLKYRRPVVTVEAPAGWIGAHVEVVTPHVEVVAPRVDVVVPSPGVFIDVDFGVGIGVGGHAHGHGHGKPKHKGKKGKGRGKWRW